MGMIEAVKSVFSKYATFKGRARRSEYWYFSLFNTLLRTIGIILGIGLSAKASGLSDFIISITGLYILASTIPDLAVSCRRLHDTGKSGAYLLLILTGIGAILIMIWLIQDSDPGDNQYGPNPKGNPIIKLTPSDSISCPSCGGKNKPGVSFCVHCGKTMKPVDPHLEKKFCKNCGAQVDKYVSVCPYCGKNPDIKETVVTSHTTSRSDNRSIPQGWDSI